MTPFLYYDPRRPDPELLRRLAPGDQGLPDAVVAEARAILSAVQADGDAAVIEYTRRFDNVALSPATLRVSVEEIAASAAAAGPELRTAIDLAIRNIRAFHKAQARTGYALDAGLGARLSLLWRPVARAGLYVPGGRAAYPTSVLMNAIPAQVAGVDQIAVFTVPGTVETNPAVAYALHSLGLTEVYRVAGAQAIGAAAFGTASIPAVDVITGPGNAWVAAAKREVVGRVGIDAIAGPSEVLILTDGSAPAHWVALDLAAQAEHDPLARCVLAATSEDVARDVLRALEPIIADSPRRTIVEAAWRDHGAVVIVDDPAHFVPLCAAMAPEHLQVMLRNPPPPASLVAGAIFVGAHAPTALGDYIAGPNHVLPTGGSARFAGPLGVQTFLRATSVVEPTAAFSGALAEHAALIADYERLPAHAAALRARATDASWPGPDPAAQIIDEVRALGRYTLSADRARVKLNQNESPWDVDHDFKQRVVDAVMAKPWNRYPDFWPDDVLDGIGALHGLKRRNVLLGNGSNELIQALFSAIAAPGVSIALPVPTFTLYAMMIAANQAVAVPVMARPDLSYDRDAWRALAKQGQAHLLICSPNNPTGAAVDAAFIEELARATSRLVVVDEAYQTFTDTDCAALVGRLPNLVVLRTLSKAAGLAGVRLGYLLAGDAIADEVNKIKLPYNVGIFGLEVARELLRRPQQLTAGVDTLIAERGRLERQLAALPGVKVFGGEANFVLIRHAAARALFDGLFARGILIRNVGAYPMLTNCLRITVGTPGQNTELLEAMRDLLATEAP